MSDMERNLIIALYPLDPGINIEHGLKVAYKQTSNYFMPT